MHGPADSVSHLGEIDRDEAIAAFARAMLEAPAGTAFVLTQYESRDAAIRAVIPYSSGEARTLAGEALDRGRIAAATPGAGTRIAEATPIDDLLFSVGESREKLFRAIAAAHAAIPDEVAPRKDTTLGDPADALAYRIRHMMTLLTSIAGKLVHEKDVIIGPKAEDRSGEGAHP